ncbi:MAG: hypothetical protein LBR67_02630 [Dysgonamonadaceae bacterium]|jgi:hypothetical protein|nr:hypothetical protein [Dysgonamonadaceae bacterium]
MKYSNLMICLLLFPVMPVGAQNNENKDSVALTREMTLEKDYSPVIRDASKINRLPELKEPTVPKTSVEFATFSMPMQLNPKLTTLPVNAYATELSFSKKRGYLSAGVGSFVDINADLGYHLLCSEADQLSIFGSHRSSNGNVFYLDDDSKQKMKINDNLLGLNYNHNFDYSKLFMGISYTHSAFNYYGDTIQYYSPFSTIMLTPEWDQSSTQVNGIFDSYFGFSAQNEDAFNCFFKAGFSHFSQKYMPYLDRNGPKENRLRADLDLNRDWSSQQVLGVKVAYDGSFYTLNENPEYDFFPLTDYESYSDIGLNPYFVYKSNSFGVRIALLVDVLLNYDKKLNVAPDFELNYRPTNKLLLYLNAKGGVTSNCLKNTFYENRYVAPSTRVLDSYSSLDAVAGLKANLGSCWLDLWAGYKIFQNEHFYKQYYDFREYEYGDYAYRDPLGTLHDITDLSKMAGRNFSMPEYRDGQVFNTGAYLKYRFTDVFELGLKATYYQWNLKSVKSETGETHPPEAWGKPDFVGNLNLSYQLPSIPLKLNLDYNLITGRKYCCELNVKSYRYQESQWFFDDYTPILSSVDSYSIASDKLKNINDLAAGATYTFSDAFSIFLNANNLLFQKYELLYGYPAQYFNVAGGINIKF